MKGRTKCPYCNKSVIVEVPDDAEGLQKTKCPNCGMSIKVDVSKRERKEEWESPIHPYVKLAPSAKPLIAGLLLIIAFILGVSMGSSLLIGPEFKGEGFYQAEVYDENKEPLENVSIYLIENGAKLVAKTDSNGYFSLNNISAGKHLIEIKKEGYKSIRVEIFVMPSSISIIKDQFFMKKGEGFIKEKTLFAMIIDYLPYLAIFFIIVSFPALIGGIFCLLKKNFIVAIIGAIFGIASIGFLIGSLFSIIALILIILSKNDFKK